MSHLEESVRWFERVLGFRVRARDEHYAELIAGETMILLGADMGSYWACELPRLPEAGRRGGGVEIVLLMEDIDQVYQTARAAGADLVRPLETWPWGMRQFWVRHPDGYLLRPAERIARPS